MNLKMGSLFAGIGGFDLGFHQAGFDVKWQVEIDPFCQELLGQRFPDVPLYPDIRDVDADDLDPVDVITMGFPCQDVSVAGKRGGLKSERSGLFYEAIRVIRGRRPRFVVLENVPGLFSSNQGWDFAAVLDEMADAGALDICWRVLDAQGYGVPQRRRRIFLVADFGAECAGEILLEPVGLPRNIAAGLAPWEGAAPEAGGGDHGSGETLAPEVAGTLRGGDRGTDDPDRATFVADSGDPTDAETSAAVTSKWHKGTGGPAGDEAQNLVAVPILEAEGRQDTKGSLRDGLGIGREGDPMFTLQSTHQHGIAVPIQDGRDIDKAQNGLGVGEEGDPGYTVDTTGAGAVGVVNVEHGLAPHGSMKLKDKVDTLGESEYKGKTLVARVDDRRRGVDEGGAMGFHWHRSNLADTEIQDDAVPTLNGGEAMGVLFDPDSPPRHYGDAIPEDAEAVGLHENQRAELRGTDGIAPELTRGGGKPGQGYAAIAARNSGRGYWEEDDQAAPIGTQGRGVHESTAVAYPLDQNSLRGEGEALTPSPDAEGRVRLRDPGLGVGKEGDPASTLAAAGPGAVAYGVSTQQTPKYGEETSPTLQQGSPSGGGQPGAVAFEPRIARNGRGAPSETVNALKAEAGSTGRGDAAPHVKAGMMVRRLTPGECERLQGMPPSWTSIEVNGKPASDGPRYRALGNAVAVPVAAWIARRMMAVFEKEEKIRLKEQNILLYSGGKGSWGAGKLLARQRGTDNLTLLFTDTLQEDEDLYRFLIEGAANIFGIPRDDIKPLLELAAEIPPAEIQSPSDVVPLGKKGGARVHHRVGNRRREAILHLAREAQAVIPSLKWLADGRDIWEVFEDRKYIGNTRVDPCSEELKRKQSNEYIKKFSPDEVVVYVGIDWTEIHRYDRLKERWSEWGYRAEAPLCEPPYPDKTEIDEWLKEAGIKQPRLYDMGFEHNNCGGFCVKAGMGHFANLLRQMPERYAFHEQKERDFRERSGKDVAILRDFRGGKTKPQTLEQFRKRVEAGEYGGMEQEPENHAGTGCGCFAG